MKFCVIGAGSGGRAFAAYLASKGCHVHLYNRSFSRIEHIKKKGGIKAKGAVKGFFPLKKITINLESAVKDVDIIMIAIPASGHRDIAKKLVPYLSQDQIVILNPGRTFGAVEFKRVIEKRRSGLNIFIAETQTLLFTTRALKRHGVRIFKIKESIKFSTFPERYNFFIEDTLKDIFPQFQSVDNYFELTLNNVGMLLHPTITLLNSGAIETGKEFKYYREGATKSICKILESIQFEINQILMKIGLKRFDFCCWATQVYGVSGKTIYDTIQKIEAYKEIESPSKLKTRYFTEDVPTGLVPLASLGKFLDVDTPTIDSIIHLSSILCGVDFWEEGRDIETLNLIALLKDELTQKDVITKVYNKKEISYII